MQTDDVAKQLTLKGKKEIGSASRPKRLTNGVYWCKD